MGGLDEFFDKIRVQNMPSIDLLHLMYFTVRKTWL